MTIFRQSGIIRLLAISLLLILFCQAVSGVEKFRTPKFRVIAFYTAENDQAHISFVHEANRWFAKMAVENNFFYDSTNDWDNLNIGFLSLYQVVIFLDSRPEKIPQRQAFEKYMEIGGTWMGFHFSAFTMSQTEFPQNWDWYHNNFLGSGEYAGNTWRPTSATLHIDDKRNPAVRHLPLTFTSSPNEWYKWKNDLRENPDIRILVSIDSSSFPLGTGPKLNEIWHSGYYPVVWTNRNYRMLYINMGHNDIDYEHNTNADLSQTFSNKNMDRLVMNGLYWLARKRKQFKGSEEGF
jgi:uncharacterized protein